MATPSRDELKRQAAEAAVALIEPGMVVGLGFGSTAAFALQHLAALLQSGQLRDIVGVPCAAWTETEARRLGVPLATLDTCATVDLTIDGADEVDPQLDLIKGGGGALLREKMVAQATTRQVIVVDEAKLSPALGTNFALPVEVVTFSVEATARFLRNLGAEVTLRCNAAGAYFVTDQGNYILDCAFGPISDPAQLAATLQSRAGIVEHGLFLNMTKDLFVAGADGVRHVQRG
ncbi:MAG: ribose-5-phosphate isomerase RpiA [Candidatus Viridilinea halotolerans]|uniref:Ribose-5-phosphate isomerase A n=1 Tax=Candidatus Viridilinea halotolerans TaxID=2491704 RepID=A0A426TSJ1_9CHLR|nr:MAG: ribose-5-phosphate isomerase RpiA [Candidatus Viridilinea halotolerans]